MRRTIFGSFTLRERSLARLQLTGKGDEIAALTRTE